MFYLRILRKLLTSINYRYRFMASIEDWLRQLLQTSWNPVMVAVVFGAALVDLLIGLFWLVKYVFWGGYRDVIWSVILLMIIPAFFDRLVHWRLALRDADEYASHGM